MDRFTVFAIAFVLVFATGCTTVPYNYEPEASDISVPPLDEVNTAFIGDRLVHIGTYQLSDAIVLDEEKKFGLFGEEYTLNSGEYIKHGEDDVADYFKVGISQSPGSIRTSRLSVLAESIKVNKQGSDICIVSVTGIAVCEKNVSFEQEQVPVIKNSTLQRTLHLQELAGHKVRVLYRAYFENLGEPVLVDDAVFDLSETKTIDYKGIQLEVFALRNDHLVYRVGAINGIQDNEN